MAVDLAVDLDAFRAGFADWLDEQEPMLARQREFHSLDFAEIVAHQAELQRALHDAGWVRYGWPPAVGGLGGDARHRGSVYEGLGARLVPLPESYYSMETLLPMLTKYAPELAAEHLVELLRGDEVWCQGFSEPDAGSDLASLRTQAVRDGTDWVMTGHKIWTSQASVATRCVVLARTGTPESRHRGLSMFLVDHDTPGVTVRAIRAMTGRDEFGEVHFDDAPVPATRLIGDEGDGWGIAMYLLQWERGMYPWQRQTSLLGALDRLVDAHAESLDPGELADAYLSVLPMRTSARNTVRELAGGGSPGPEVSVDKVLLSRSELLVNDLADAVLGGAIELDDDAGSAAWRLAYLFSRSAPIYGGSVEIQRTILAERVLGLPRG